MAKTSISSSNSPELSKGANAIVNSVNKVMNYIDSNSFDGSLKDFLSDWKKALTGGSYSYSDYVDAEAALTSMKFKGVSQHIFETEVLTIIKKKQTGIRISKIIGDKLEAITKDFNSKDKDGNRIYDIVENNTNMKSKMVQHTVKTLDKVESDLHKLFDRLNKREGLD